MSGRTYNIDSSRLLAPLSKETVKKIADVVRKHMKELGYTEVPHRRKSYLTISIVTDVKSNIPQELADKGLSKDSVIKTTTSHYENGKLTTTDEKQNAETARFAIGGQINRYGKRPELMNKLWLNSPAATWTAYEKELPEIVDQSWVGMFPPAPKENEKMQGDPGCLPRFGFDENELMIINVVKNSPAADAGMKVGDLIVALDSEKPKSNNYREELYIQRTKVPVKLKRGDKIIRTNIQARLMCE